jgi:hypothetical protein
MESQGYKSHRDKLLRLLNHIQFRQYIGGEYGNKIMEASRLIVKDLDEIEESSAPLTTLEERSFIRNVVYLTEEVLAEIQFSQFFIDLIKEFLLLVSNWNKNIYKNENIDKKVNFIKNVLDMQMTIYDAVNINKKLLTEAKKVLNARPEAYSVARHYASMLERAVKNRTCDNQGCNK